MIIHIDKIKFDKAMIEKKLITGSNRMKEIYNLCRNIEYQQEFEPGQVLVLRQIKDTHRTKAGTLELNSAGAVQKYIVANKIEGGLVLCRRLGLDGRPGKAITIIAAVDYNEYRFEEDPDIADSILLDLDYDPLQIPKIIGKARKKMKEHNNKLRFKNAMFNIGFTSSIQFLATLFHQSGGAILIWSLEDDIKRTKYSINKIDITGNRAELYDGQKIVAVDQYDLTRSYGEKFFIGKPMTRDEALTIVKSK